MSRLAHHAGSSLSHAFPLQAQLGKDLLSVLGALEPEPVVAPLARRTRIYDLNASLHCSIIGTCLSTGELRQVLVKVKAVGAETASEHDLHGLGVLLAGRRDATGKLLHKTLDRRHRLAISRLDRSQTIAEVRALWRDAVQRGDIPGTYWAVLTHPLTDDAVIREVFGEVHMLSHLVGAANRADIRRLAVLEAERDALQDKVARQEAQLRDTVAARDATIRDLNRLLSRTLADQASPAADRTQAEAAGEQTALKRLVASLEQQLTHEGKRRERSDRRLEGVETELATERQTRLAAEQRERALRDELEAIEPALAAAPAGAGADVSVDLGGLSLLYVGGRDGEVAHLRAAAERCRADLIHHDGHVDGSGLLAGLVSRADAVLFPVDCVSHDAALTVKRLCRQSGKPFVPLRSTGVGSFLAAVRRPIIAALAPAPA